MKSPGSRFAPLRGKLLARYRQLMLQIFNIKQPALQRYFRTQHIDTGRAARTTTAPNIGQRTLCVVARALCQRETLLKCQRVQKCLRGARRDVITLTIQFKRCQRLRCRCRLNTPTDVTPFQCPADTQGSLGIVRSLIETAAQRVFHLKLYFSAGSYTRLVHLLASRLIAMRLGRQRRVLRQAPLDSIGKG